ncbi:MAG TPA: hypothetical protein VIV61_07480 [Candidatus Ozemobacteraceae bacterium]
MRHDRLGTSFAEVILAVAIMMFAMLPIFGMMSSSNTATRMQKIEGVAANLAKEEMNRWMYILDPESFPADGVEYPVDVQPIEGNEVEIKVWVYRHENTTTNVVYPKFEWHDFRACVGGSEHNNLDGKTTPFTRPVQEVTRDEAPKTFRLVDIVLRARWRTPNTAWSEVNQFFLVSRRGYM